MYVHQCILTTPSLCPRERREELTGCSDRSLRTITAGVYATACLSTTILPLPSTVETAQCCTNIDEMWRLGRFRCEPLPVVPWTRSQRIQAWTWAMYNNTPESALSLTLYGLDKRRGKEHALHLTQPQLTHLPLSESCPLRIPTTITTSTTERLRTRALFSMEPNLREVNQPPPLPMRPPLLLWPRMRSWSSRASTPERRPGPLLTCTRVERMGRPS